MRLLMTLCLPLENLLVKMVVQDDAPIPVLLTAYSDKTFEYVSMLVFNVRLQSRLLACSRI